MEAEVACGVIFGSVPCDDWSFLNEYLRRPFQVYCADGGLLNAKAAGLRPDFLIGDWDSGGAPVQGIPTCTLPPEKDMTDLQAAIDLALKNGCSELLLCGCMGGRRLDHTASNLVILEWLADRGGHGMILDQDNEVRLLDGEFVVLDAAALPRYHYFSLVPLDRIIPGVYLDGVKYPLVNATLTRGDTLSVSNEPAGNEIHIRIGKGRVLLIRSQRK